MNTELYKIRPLPKKESWSSVDPLEKLFSDRLPARFASIPPYSGVLPHIKEGYFITGDTQTGKSYLAASIFKQYCYSVRDVKTSFFFDVAELIEMSKIEANGNNSFFHIDENGEKVKPISLLEKCLRANFLVLDDLGASRVKMTDWALERLWLIINHRYAECKPYIVTSNLSIDEISKAVSHRISSRLSVLGRIALSKIQNTVVL